MHDADPGQAAAPRRPIRALDVRLDVHRLACDAPVPERLLGARWVWVARTDDELSVISPPDPALAAIAEVSAGWAVLQVVGPIEHTVVGLLAEIARVLATEGITILAQSTYDTDYVMVRGTELPRALAALRAAGFPPG